MKSMVGKIEGGRWVLGKAGDSIGEQMGRAVIE